MAQVVLKNVRLSFPVLWKPEQFEGQGEPRFSATFLVEPGSDTDKAIRKAIQDEATTTWGAKAAQTLKALSPQPGKFAYQNGENKAHKYSGFEGMWALTSHRQAKTGAPKIVDQAKNPLTADSGKPYAGCYVNAVVDIWCQKAPYEGVRATLVAIQFVKDGDAFAGAPATDDAFEVLEDADDDFADFG